MGELTDIRLKMPVELRDMIEKVVLAYKKPKTKVLIDMLWLLHDNPKMLADKFPKAFDGRTISDLVKDLGSPTTTKAQSRAMDPSERSKKQILPNFVITAGRSDRISAQVKAFLEGEASRKPRWQFDLFSAPSDVRITAYNTTIETSVGSTSFDSYYNDIDHLPRALPFNSWWLPVTETVHVEGNSDYTSYISKDVGSIPFEAASDIMHGVETSVERLDYTFKEAWEFNKQAWLDKQ